MRINKLAVGFGARKSFTCRIFSKHCVQLIFYLLSICPRVFLLLTILSPIYPFTRNFSRIVRAQSSIRKKIMIQLPKIDFHLAVYIFFFIFSAYCHSHTNWKNCTILFSCVSWTAPIVWYRPKLPSGKVSTKLFRATGKKNWNYSQIERFSIRATIERLNASETSLDSYRC